MRAQQPGTVKKITLLTFLVLIVVSILWLYIKITHTTLFPIKQVTVGGQYQHIDRQQLQQALLPLVNTGFFNVDIQAIQHELLAFPWVAKVNVRRIWPNKLAIHFVEQHPVAIWNDRSLFNRKGVLFSPSRLSYDNSLPRLVGPKRQSAEVFRTYSRMQMLFQPLNITIMRLSLSPSHAWQVQLSNGTLLVLGRDQLWQRLRRYIDVYQRLLSPSNRVAVRVDMRYSSGMAVKWVENEA